jgi:chromatin remodeling complex protein RSC6
MLSFGTGSASFVPAGHAAFMKPMTPSAALGAVVGTKAIPRTEVTKKLWAYIKRKGLQDKKNRRNINADAALKAVFGGRGTVNMFEMTKLVSRHLK